LSNLVAKKVDGIILVSCGNKCQREHFMPEKYRIPMVLLDRKLDGSNCFGVYADNEYVTFRACETLIHNGSKEIAFISGSIGTYTSLERLNGYKDALKQYGIAFNPELIKKGNYTMESGYEAVLELERAGICYSAVIAANDMMALGALKALKELSYQVPEERLRQHQLLTVLRTAAVNHPTADYGNGQAGSGGAAENDPGRNHHRQHPLAAQDTLSENNKVRESLEKHSCRWKYQY
jgi:hypothetical protein